MHGVPAGPISGQERAGALALRDARDRHGAAPETWLDEALRATGTPLITLGLPTRGHFLALRCGATSSTCDSRFLPVRSRAVASAALDMCLPTVPDLDGLFTELRRVMRPTGTVAALVPSLPRGSMDALRVWRPLHRAMGGRPTFRHESARDSLHWLFAAADFAVLLDQRRTFRLPVPEGMAAGEVVDALVRGGVWPADIPAERLDLARQALTRYAAPGRSLPIPLRLLVARR